MHRHDLGMNKLRRAVLLLIALAATAWSGHALAVPPVLAPPAAQAVITNYIRAVKANDLSGYRKLFAPDARVAADWPIATGRDAWLSAISREFAATRQTRFLAVFSGSDEFNGAPATRALLVQEIKDCRPGIAECFGQFRSETLTIQNGQIVALDRARYTHRLLEPGGWTFFAP